MTDFNQDDENDSAQIDPQEDDLIQTEEDLVETKNSEENQSDNETIGSLPKAVKISEDLDENELVLPDDAEADLLTILESKIHAESLEDQDDIEESLSHNDEDSIAVLLKPRRSDEEHCQTCWLLVRKTAPKCPEHRDDCSIFKNVG